MRTLASDTDPQDSARLGEELWETVFANPHIGVALIGPDRRFRKANERFRELVGYTEEELRGLTVLQITHPEDRERHQKAADELRSGEQRDAQLEKRYVRKDGGVIWVRVTAVMISGREENGLAVALVEDVTDRKLAVSSIETAIGSFCVRRPNRTRADMPPGEKPRILLSSL